MKKLRIGTRSSKLATWQATKVQVLLSKKNIESELVFIQSAGDLIQNTPIHETGMPGLFTKALDDALLNNEIDCAVHSCKDLPSTLHSELTIAACLEREDPRDILVCKQVEASILSNNPNVIIATGSVRRKAQWLSKFSQHQIVNLRGNVDTRLKKLHENSWHGALFAYAGLNRLNIQPEKYLFPDWMVPAPAQGVIAVVCKKSNASVANVLFSINHETTAITTTIERDFLRLIDGGCVIPIGALATIENNIISFKIAIHNTDGSKGIIMTFRDDVESHAKLSKLAYDTAMAHGAGAIISSLK